MKKIIILILIYIIGRVIMFNERLIDTKGISVKFLIAIVCIIFFGILWFFPRRHPTKMKPLFIDKNNPLMKKAFQKAKDSIPKFKALFLSHPENACVKIPFQSSTGQTEFIWAEVLKLDDKTMDIRLLTPPITHTGKVARLQTIPVEELVDWSIQTKDDKIKGGFTQRIMFQLYKEKYGELPGELKKEEPKYLP